MTVLELMSRIKNNIPPELKRWIPVIILSILLLLLILLFLLLPHGEKPAEPEPFIEPSPTPPPPLLVTAEQMSRLSYTDSTLGEIYWSLSEDSLLELNRVLEEYGICEPEEISHFLAQATVETLAGRKLTEVGDEAYFQSRGYTTGTRGAGYLHITYEYGQMAFATWMMKKYIPELYDIEYKNPATSGKDEITAAYYEALQTAANLGLDISLYSKIVFDSNSKITTGADYIAQTFAWESAGYYWYIAGIGDALSPIPGVGNVDIASDRIGGGNRQSRREAYMAFYPVLSEMS